MATPDIADHLAKPRHWNLVQSFPQYLAIKIELLPGKIKHFWTEIEFPGRSAKPRHGYVRVSLHARGIGF
jgi:hypothetical protein